MIEHAITGEPLQWHESFFLGFGFVLFFFSLLLPFFIFYYFIKKIKGLLGFLLLKAFAS